MPNMEQPKGGGSSSLFSSKASLKSSRKSSAKSSMTGSKKKKKGKLKRLSGFITGESRREKKARKAAERAAAGKPPLKPGEEDDESVYDIDVDDLSVATERIGGGGRNGSTSRTNLLSPRPTREVDGGEEKNLPFLSPKPTPALQVILLLMDPNTRRFELLQLEFDSDKALVSDVISQIPISVTEEQLRSQDYDGICDRAGLEMIKTMRLCEFCRGNEVVLGIPKSMTAKECAKLAHPILADEGVASMLRASGVNTELPALVEQDDDADPEIVPPTPPPKKDDAAVTADGFQTWFVVTIAFIAILLNGAQMYITAPLKPGSVMPPEMWMSKCGLLSALPVCENAGLEMNNDGILRLYGSDGEVRWTLAGGKCRANSPDCEPGLVVKDDGNLVIGGKHITSVTISGDAPLTPWPFELEPKLRVVRK